MRVFILAMKIAVVGIVFKNFVGARTAAALCPLTAAESASSRAFQAWLKARQTFPDTQLLVAAHAAFPLRANFPLPQVSPNTAPRLPARVAKPVFLCLQAAVTEIWRPFCETLSYTHRQKLLDALRRECLTAAAGPARRMTELADTLSASR